GAPNKEYWLYHGAAIPKANDQPPWPKKASPWAKAVPKPEVYFDQIDPDEDGRAVVWYRSREDASDSRSSRRQEAQTSLTNAPENKSQSLLTSAATNLQAVG